MKLFFSQKKKQIDLTGTRLHLKDTVKWIHQGFPKSFHIQDFNRTNNNLIVSAKCGGYCGRCRPKGGFIAVEPMCLMPAGKHCFVMLTATKKSIENVDEKIVRFIFRGAKNSVRTLFPIMLGARISSSYTSAIESKLAAAIQSMYVPPSTALIK